MLPAPYIHTPSKNQWPGFWQGVKEFWSRTKQVTYVLWVLRVPVVFTLLGFLLLLRVPQAQDLLVNTADNVTDANADALVLFTALIFGVWAAPMHYVSRLLLETDAGLNDYIKNLDSKQKGFVEFVVQWTPRILGVLAFVAVISSCIRAISNLPDLEFLKISTAPIEYSLYGIMIVSTLFACLFIYYTIRRRDIFRSPAVKFIQNFRDRLLKWSPAQRLTGLLPSQIRSSAPSFGVLYLIVLTIVFCILPLAYPERAAKYIPLALFIPFVIGGWLPILSLLSGFGRRIGVPLVAICLSILWLGPAIIGEGYGVRRIENAPEHIAKLKDAQGKPEPGETTLGPLLLTEAVRLWMHANACEGQPRLCPRPIIVVASGGASRAGFFTASAIGALLESKNFKPDALVAPHGLTPEQAYRRIFAFSTVSGSSVGAAMTVAALAAADDSMAHPCKSKIAAEVKYWHRFTEENREISDWRDCLEALMSGDYLTPTFSGFMFRDVFRILNYLPDRATLLEVSWEQHFKRVIDPTKQTRAKLACVSSLECPFRSLRPTKSRWLPLLVLNGTSVTTGQRIVTSALEWPARSDAPQLFNPELAKGECITSGRKHLCAIFDNAFLYHWLAGAREADKDIAISTAALNSARFPLISPPGEVYAWLPDKNGKKVLTLQDRIVDGGYFENYGALTALELVSAIQIIHPELAPYIISLTNDPDIPFGFDASNAPGAGNVLAIDLVGPLDAIMNARSAAGYIAVTGIEKILKPNMNGKCVMNSAAVRVWPPLRKKKVTQPEMFEQSHAGADQYEIEVQRPLSMSWWLSRPVQRYLHHQITIDERCKDNMFCDANREDLSSIVEHAFAKPAGCFGAPTFISNAIALELNKRLDNSTAKLQAPSQYRNFLNRDNRVQR
jgi:hypothetical protein